MANFLWRALFRLVWNRQIGRNWWRIEGADYGWKSLRAALFGDGPRPTDYWFETFGNKVKVPLFRD